jgi:DNA-binding HxlR family transcriptional regulator
MRYDKSRALIHLHQEGTMWGRSHHLVTMTMRKFEPIILDEDCAPRRVLELFSVKWTTMLLHSLHFNGGTCRTGALARSLPGCSKKMLTQTLREMERDGLIDRWRHHRRLFVGASPAQSDACDRRSAANRCPDCDRRCSPEGPTEMATLFLRRLGFGPGAK